MTGIFSAQTAAHFVRSVPDRISNPNLCSQTEHRDLNLTKFINLFGVEGQLARAFCSRWSFLVQTKMIEDLTQRQPLSNPMQKRRLTISTLISLALALPLTLWHISHRPVHAIQIPDWQVLVVAVILNAELLQVRPGQALRHAVHLSLLLLPPVRQTVVQADFVLCLLVRRHVVLEAAPSLRKGAGAVVNPLGAIDFLLLGFFGTRHSGPVDLYSS